MVEAPGVEPGEMGKQFACLAVIYIACAVPSGAQWSPLSWVVASVASTLGACARLTQWLACYPWASGFLCSSSCLRVDLRPWVPREKMPARWFPWQRQSELRLATSAGASRSAGLCGRRVTPPWETALMGCPIAHRVSVTLR